MTCEHDFIQAILADPDSDIPRLLLADWYDENGQPDRAEFIRNQLQLYQEGMDILLIPRGYRDNKLPKNWFPPVSMAEDLFFQRGMPEGIAVPHKITLR